MRAQFEARVELEDRRHLTMKNRYKKLNALFNRLNVNLIEFMDSMTPPTKLEHVEVEEDENYSEL